MQISLPDPSVRNPGQEMHPSRRLCRLRETKPRPIGARLAQHDLGSGGRIRIPTDPHRNVECLDPIGFVPRHLRQLASAHVV
ncbi:hypothetical protein, partial [Haematobacter sp. UBA3484]